MEKAKQKRERQETRKKREQERRKSRRTKETNGFPMTALISEEEADKLRKAVGKR